MHNISNKYAIDNDNVKFRNLLNENIFFLQMGNTEKNQAVGGQKMGSWHSNIS